MYKIKVLPMNYIYEANEDDLILNILSLNKHSLSAPCGGNGKCGKCLVRLLEGKISGVTPDENGYFLSCQGKAKSDLVINVENVTGMGLSNFETFKVTSRKEGFGTILDIGTTTLAACLVDFKTGEIVKKCSSLNPQSVCGADVISRIQASIDGKLGILQSLIVKEVNDIIKELSNGEDVKELVIGGNTTMLHLFKGVDPKTIGYSPFVPVFTETQIIDGKDLDLPVKTVRLLPSASAYIGGDVTAGILSCKMDEGNDTKLFVDIGTNGEVVLSHCGKLHATSTAAGPALEGACIECGIGGIPGAIDKIEIIDGELIVHAISEKEPIGICGSGLIDIIAVLLKEKMIDETGAWDEESNSLLMKYKKEDKFYLTDKIYISQKDIRQFQLAKSAICSGIKTLLNELKIDASQVEKTYVAGGLGYYMNMQRSAL